MTTPYTLDKPYDLNVPDAELDRADRWWANLSINQMKAFQAAYFPNTSWLRIGRRGVHQIWEDKGKPLPDPVWPPT